MSHTKGEGCRCTLAHGFLIIFRASGKPQHGSGAADPRTSTYGVNIRLGNVVDNNGQDPSFLFI
jgi:hypothetical protein